MEGREISVALSSTCTVMFVQMAKLGEFLNTEMKMSGMQFREMDGSSGIYNALGSFTELQNPLMSAWR